MGRLLLGLAVVFCCVSCTGSGRTNKNGQAAGEIDTVSSRAPEGFYGFLWGTTKRVIIDSLGPDYFYETPYFVGYRDRDFGGRPATEVGFYFTDDRLRSGECIWNLTNIGDPAEKMAAAITAKYNQIPRVEKDSTYCCWDWEWVWGDAEKREQDWIRLFARYGKELSVEIRCTYWSRKAQDQYGQEKMNRDF